MIPAAAWVPRGAARANPIKIGTDEEMVDGEGMTEAQIAAEARRVGEEDEAGENKGDESNPVRRAQKAQDDLNKLVIETYGLDKYDEEEDNAVEPIEGVMHYKDNTEDPHLKGEAGDDDSEEINDVTIRPTDLIIVSVANEEDYNHLDVYVYDEKEDNLFIHHDVILPESPLCVAWLDYNAQQATERGNFVAVGTFEPGIEIYNLDIVDTLEPTIVLGGRVAEADMSAKQKKKKKTLFAPLKEGSHSQAVMSLAWNSVHRNGLASGGADNTVKLWDLNTGACAATLAHCEDKVQAVRWHPTEATVLVTGTVSGQLTVLDVRSPTALRSWKLGSGIEQISWNPLSPQFFLASTENGEVACFNAMQVGTVMWRLAAHNKECTGLAINPQVPGLLATASVDKKLKFWDCSGAHPTLLCSKSPGIGKIFSLSFCPESPYLLVAGGDNVQPLIIDSKGFSQVCVRYGLPTPAAGTEDEDVPAATAANDDDD